jgi:rod shape-determining protein MreC
MFEPDRTYARRDTALFFLCVGLSLGALFSPESWQTAVANSIRRSALAPLLALQELAEESRTSRFRIDALVAERDSAAAAAQALPLIKAENEQLRLILGLARRLPTPSVPAEVLHQALPTDGRTMLLSTGRRAGVAPFQPVVAPEGLLGLIRTAGSRTSIAMSWAHPEFRASALTEDGSVFGIVAATESSSESEPMLELRGVPYRDTVEAGTRVITSGLGGVYPRGIPIGTVVGIARESEGWERTYLVLPAAHPGRASHVLVLQHPAAWPADSVPHEDSLP